MACRLSRLFFGFMVITFVAVAMLKVKETKAEVPPSIASSLGLLKHPCSFWPCWASSFTSAPKCAWRRFLQPTVVGSRREFKDLHRRQRQDKDGNLIA